jgi:6-phosphogluconolactonase/glucosamine-6-phosphate isomerase/deaminase
LLLEGQDKLNTVAEAMEDGPADAMPIRTVLRGASDRLTIFSAQRV